MTLLTALNREERTIILVTHDHAVARHAQRVLQMQDGEFVSSI
jgi:ABC-type lipoprotein export system ATPase subunit